MLIDWTRHHNDASVISVDPYILAHMILAIVTETGVSYKMMPLSKRQKTPKVGSCIASRIQLSRNEYLKSIDIRQI